MTQTLSQRWCGWRRGHDTTLAFEGRRVFLRCTSCAHETPGWVVSTVGPRVRYAGDPRRRVLAPARLVLRRRA